MKAGGNTLHSEIHKLINNIWNKEELPQEWKEYIIVPVCKNSGNIYCSNYRGTHCASCPVGTFPRN